MERTTECHHQIADALLPQTDAVLHNPTALDTAVDMLDPQPTLMQGLVGQVLLPCQFLGAWLLGRHEDVHLRERERQEAQILQQPAPGRSGVGCRVGNGLIMDMAAVGVTAEEDRQQDIHEQNILIVWSYIWAL
jgi:hypothetical protein